MHNTTQTRSCKIIIKVNYFFKNFDVTHTYNYQSVHGLNINEHWLCNKVVYARAQFLFVRSLSFQVLKIKRVNNHFNLAEWMLKKNRSSMITFHSLGLKKVAYKKWSKLHISCIKPLTSNIIQNTKYLWFYLSFLSTWKTRNK